MDHLPPSPSPAPTPTPSFWHDLLSLHREFKVCRFSLVVAVLGYLVFLHVAQGVEVLRSLGEESSFNFLGSGPLPALKWLGIVLGALMWSLAGWYTCRVLLFFDFSADRGTVRPSSRWWAWLQPRLREQLPRVFGVVPLLIMALGFWHASGTYDPNAHTNAPGWLRAYAVACVVLAATLYMVLVFRLRVLGIRPAGTVRFGGRQNGKKRVADLENGTRIALATMTGVSLALLLFFTLNPISFGGSIGAGAVLLFAAACWVFWGSVAVYVFARYRIPVIAIAVFWVALCSLWNDNHAVRSAPPDGFARPKLDQAFEAWHANVAKHTQEPVHPLFIVATEGGGIRAAYWTATVLGKLEDDCAAGGRSSFADHLFAISGVSGGSLGAATFDAALAGGPAGPIRPRMQKMLGEDFLAPPLAALLYPDFAQRLLPFPVTFLDRGRWLEKSWEQAGQRHLGNDFFARNFNDLWTGPATRGGYLPALFLNGTTVESGQRIIASNVVISNGFLDAIDISAKVATGDDRDCDTPLSTAAHGSARFTYVSPAGRFRDGTHIVDGGYFENSGSTTAMEILRDVKKLVAERGLTDVQPYMIFISNDPLSAPSGGRDLKRNDAATKVDQQNHRPRSFLEDALAPVWAMLNTRDAHNSYAQLALREAQAYEHVYYFGLSPSTIPLPLGWKLSGTSAREMNRQAEESCATVDGKDNPETFREIVALLK